MKLSILQFSDSEYQHASKGIQNLMLMFSSIYQNTKILLTLNQTINPAIMSFCWFFSVLFLFNSKLNVFEMFLSIYQNTKILLTINGTINPAKLVFFCTFPFSVAKSF